MSSGEPILASALQECVEIMATLQHTTARRTHSTTHAHTNMNDRHTNTASDTQKKCAPAVAWRGGDGVVRARVEDASLAGCTGHGFRAGGTEKLETCRPGRTEEGRAEPAGGRAALNFFTVTLQCAHTKNSHSHMHLHKQNTSTKIFKHPYHAIQ